MNRIQKLFSEKQQNILSIYATAGFPKKDDTLPIIVELEKAGADIVEIGIPFSDPLADGKTIQESSSVALQNGMSIPLLFEQISEIRKQVQIPLLLMGYLNPIYQYGIEKFCKTCSEIGVDGLIIPDLPVWEYTNTYQHIFERYDILNIFLITPQTPEQRIRDIDALSKGFIYMVSSAATTGSKSNIKEEQIAYFKRITALELENPLLIGFGISNHETYTTACTYANGVIIGSAFIQELEKADSVQNSIHSFIQNIRGNK